VTVDIQTVMVCINDRKRAYEAGKERESANFLKSHITYKQGKRKEGQPVFGYKRPYNP